MSVVGKTEGYVAYVKKPFEWKKVWIEPNMSSNGTWRADGYSCEGYGLDNLTNLYKVFNGTYTGYLNKFNKDAWIEICLPQATEVEGCYMASSDGYFPATGDIYYSDNGSSYTKCGSWTDTSNSKNVTAYVTKGSGAHRIWRFVSTGRSTAYPTSNADVSVVKLFTEVKEYLPVDNTLPVGAGGRVVTYVAHQPHMGVEVTKVESYYTYVKERDTSSLPKGSGGRMEVYVTYTEKPPEPPPPSLIIDSPIVYVTYRMHDGVDLKAPEIFTTYHPHDGVDLNKLSVFYTYRNDAEWGEGGRLPLGCGGKVEAYITQALSSLVGYLNDYGMQRIQGIVLGSDYYPLKKIQSFNNLFFANNTTGDG